MKGMKKMSKKGFSAHGKTKGEAYPAKASGLPVKKMHRDGSSGDSYPAGSLQANPA